MEPFELDPAEWDDVSELISAQLEDRGLATDAAGVAEVLRLDWYLFADKALRDRMLLHRKHSRLDSSITETEKSSDDMKLTKRGLAADPGPPTTR